MVQEWWLVGGGAVVGMGAVIAVMDFIGFRRRWCHRRPVTRGQLHLFDDDGEGHVISAKLPAVGLERLLKDVNSGRFG